jgi:hypothetical protein
LDYGYENPSSFAKAFKRYFGTSASQWRKSGAKVWIQERQKAKTARQLVGRFRLLGTRGLVGMALSGIDMALWDALARVHSASLLGIAWWCSAAGACLRSRRVRRQSENWVRDRRRRSRSHSRDSQFCWPGRRDHGGLQPVSHARRGGTAAAVRRGRRTHMDRRANPGARLQRPRPHRTRDSHADSGAAKTGGACATCSTPSKLAQAIT